MNNNSKSKASKEPGSPTPQQVDTNDLAAAETSKKVEQKTTKELGGPKGLEPTRYGDWEAKGRCYDF